MFSDLPVLRSIPEILRVVVQNCWFLIMVLLLILILWFQFLLLILLLIPWSWWKIVDIDIGSIVDLFGLNRLEISPWYRRFIVSKNTSQSLVIKSPRNRSVPIIGGNPTQFIVLRGEKPSFLEELGIFWCEKHLLWLVVSTILKNMKVTGKGYPIYHGK